MRDEYESVSMCRLHGELHTPAQKAAVAALLRNCFSFPALFWRVAKKSTACFDFSGRERNERNRNRITERKENRNTRCVIAGRRSCPTSQQHSLD